MKTNFKIFKKLKKAKIKVTIVVAGAHDEPVIQALKSTDKYLHANFILIGDENIINKLISQYKLLNTKVVHELDIVRICELAVSEVKINKNAILMKGLVDTKYILKPVVSSNSGLKDKKILSHVALFNFPWFKKTLLVSDCAMNINPTVDEKWEIIENAVMVCQKIGIERPKVGLVSAVEKVNPKMVSTIDAQTLIEKHKNDATKQHFVLDGPFAIDNLVSLESSKHKGIGSEVAGKADVLIFPEIVSGNVFYKTATFLSHSFSAGVIVGAKCPIVLTSRADSAQTKLNSILFAAFIVDKNI